MRIRKPRGITRGQIVLVTVLGVFGGVYIWRPLVDSHFGVRRPAIKSTEPAEEEKE